MNTGKRNNKASRDDRREGPGKDQSAAFGELPQQWRHKSEFRAGSRWPGPPWSQAMRVEVVTWRGPPLVVIGLDVARLPVELTERPRIGFFSAPPGVWFTAFTEGCRVMTPVSCALHETQWAREKDELINHPELPELMLAVVNNGILWSIDRYPSHPDWWRELRAAIDGPHNTGDLRQFVEACDREGSLIQAAERIGCLVHFADGCELTSD